MLYKSQRDGRVRNGRQVISVTDALHKLFIEGSLNPEDEATIGSLFSWKARAVVVLRQLALISLDDVTDKCHFIMAVSTFDGDDKFSSPECPPLSKGESSIKSNYRTSGIMFLQPFLRGLNPTLMLTSSEKFSLKGSSQFFSIIPILA